MLSSQRIEEIRRAYGSPYCIGSLPVNELLAHIDSLTSRRDEAVRERDVMKKALAKIAGDCPARPDEPRGVYDLCDCVQVAANALAKEEDDPHAQ